MSITRKSVCFILLFILGVGFAAAIQAQDDTPPVPIPDSSINAEAKGIITAKLKTRETALKFHLRLKINKEKRKRLFQRDNDLIAKYEAILDSPEFIEYILEKGEPEFEAFESKFFDARGPPTAKEFGDGVLLEKILEWIDNGGLDKLLDFILKLIDAFADASNHAALGRIVNSKPKPKNPSRPDLYVRTNLEFRRNETQQALIRWKLTDDDKPKEWIRVRFDN